MSTVIPPELIAALIPVGTKRLATLPTKAKYPPPKGWAEHENQLEPDDPELVAHLERGGNYAVVGGRGLVLMDTDAPETEAIARTLPPTFMVQSGGEGERFHRYYSSDLEKTIPLRKAPAPGEKKRTYGELRCSRAYVVAPGSIHPDTGNEYKVYDPRPLTFVSEAQLREAFKEYIEPDPTPAPPAPRRENSDLDNLTIEDVLNAYGVKYHKEGSELRFANPQHGSDSGRNTSANPDKGVWRCHPCQSGGGPLELVAVCEGIISCEQARPGGLRGEDFKKTLEAAREKKLLPENEKPPSTEDTIDATVAPRVFQTLLSRDQKLRDLFEGLANSQYKTLSRAEAALCVKLLMHKFGEAEVRSFMAQSQIGKWNKETDSYRDNMIKSSHKAAQRFLAEKEEKDAEKAEKEKKDAEKAAAALKKAKVEGASRVLTRFENPNKETVDRAATLFDDLFNPEIDQMSVVLSFIEDTYTFATPDDVETLYLYRDGVYVPGKTIVEEFVEEILGDKTSSGFCSEVINHFKRRSYVPRNAFNKFEGEIPVLNGLLNLETMQLRDFDPKKIFTYKINTRFHPDKDCPQFKAALNQILPKEDEQALLQEYAGYTLWPEFPHHKFIVFIGVGRNGKGVIIRTIVGILGPDNVSNIRLEYLDGSHRFTVPNLFGKLMNVCSEPATRRPFKTELLKQITGQDTLDGEIKGKQNPLRFIPFAKFFVQANKLPRVDDTTLSFWDRILIIEFTNTFTDEKENKVADIERTWLDDEDERSGILNWMIEGLKRLNANGRFTQTKSMDENILEFKRASDPIGAFLTDPDECVYGSMLWTTRDDLYNAYKDYADNIGAVIESTGAFVGRIKKLSGVVEGFKKIATKTTRIWKGISAIQKKPTLEDFNEEEARAAQLAAEKAAAELMAQEDADKKLAKSETQTATEDTAKETHRDAAQGKLENDTLDTPGTPFPPCKILGNDKVVDKQQEGKEKQVAKPVSSVSNVSASETAQNGETGINIAESGKSDYNRVFNDGGVDPRGKPGPSTADAPNLSRLWSDVSDYFRRLNTKTADLVNLHEYIARKKHKITIDEFKAILRGAGYKVDGYSVTIREASP